ncbi:MAG: hypothetical protein B7X53_00025 [Hyphomonas sp. 34-62-18]|nr:helix-turn-helix transcriptional regulator [Hyphomonas sp. 34-62-18]OZB19389.1 MAG: hypothetical protein B7X53_00025 [Hyphomonas sp. 34-62-18]
MGDARGTNKRSPTDIDRLVGANVRALRIQLGVPLAELAVTLRISHQQLQKYETGANRLSAGMLAAIAKTLSVPIDDLYRRNDGKEGSKTTQLDRARSKCRHLVDTTQSVDTLNTMARVLRAL